MHPGDGCIHCVFSHSLFLCGVKLGDALLLDIIQLGFLKLQPCLSNEMATIQRFLILLVVLSGLLSDSIWAFVECCHTS
ncbi:hypothetical protein EMIT0P43_30529 [Pseudomonas jessenii]